MTRDELVKLISAPLIKDRYAPDHVRHYAGLQLDALSAAGYAVVPLEATEAMVEAAAVLHKLVDELCASVDAAGDDVGGHRGSLTILREIGPADAALAEALAALDGKEPTP